MGDGQGGSPNLAYSAAPLNWTCPSWVSKRSCLAVDGYVAILRCRDVGAPPPVHGNDDGYGVAKTPGAVSDPQFSHQPIQQVYAFEAFIRYCQPSTASIRMPRSRWQKATRRSDMYRATLTAWPTSMGTAAPRFNCMVRWRSAIELDAGRGPADAGPGQR